MNPFTYGTVVKGENFYDREEDCKHIVDILAGGNNLVCTLIVLEKNHWYSKQ